MHVYADTSEYRPERQSRDYMKEVANAIRSACHTVTLTVNPTIDSSSPGIAAYFERRAQDSINRLSAVVATADTANMAIDFDKVFLESIYQAVEEQQSRRAARRVLREFNTRLGEERFREADIMLARVIPKRLDADCALSFLTATYAVKDKLPSRALLAKRTKERLTELVGSQRATNLVARLS